MSDLDHLYEMIGELRNLIREGVVTNVDDTGQVQTVDVMTNDGVLHTGIEVMHAAGTGGVAPVNGAICTVLAIGGDPANLRALPPRSPSTRLGGQASGDNSVSTPDGTRVTVRNGGIIEIMGGQQVTVNSPQCVIIAPDGASITTPTYTINGNMQLNGALTATGDVVANNRSLEQHTHPVEGSVTGPPNATATPAPLPT